MFYAECIWGVYILPERRSDVFMSHEANYTMKRSPQRKVLDVSAETVSPSDRNAYAEVSPMPSKRSITAVPSDQPALGEPTDGLEFDQGLDSELSQCDSDGSAVTDSWEDGMADEKDFWSDSAEDESEDDPLTISKEYLEDEFALDLKDDPEFVLFAQDLKPEPKVSEILKRGMVRALALQSSPDFLEEILQTLNQAIAALPVAQPDPKSSRNGSRNNHNSDYFDSKRWQSAQSLRNRLRALSFLTQRYAKRGLDEWELLEDAIDLVSETDGKTLSHLLAGLAARIAIRPKLEQSGQPLSPALGQKLLRAAERSMSLLSRQFALEALPGLAQTVGQHGIRRQRSLEELPTDFYQAAIRLAANPDLQKRLTNCKTELSGVVSITQKQMPMKLRIDGPLEIHIQRLQE